MTVPPTNYGEYLRLNELLSLQKPMSAIHGPKEAHEETLFIIVHQVYELWFRQILHELDSVLAVFSRERVSGKAIGTCVARLQRICEIQKLLIDQFHVLETMTSLDFMEFRGYLSHASGFQSLQFRLIENKLGLRPEQRLRYDEGSYYKDMGAPEQGRVKEAESGESLFVGVERWLERTPFIEDGDYTFWRDYQAAVGRLLDEQRSNIKAQDRLSEANRERQLQSLARTESHFAALFDDSLYAEILKSGQRRLSRRATLSALFISFNREEPILQIPFRLLTALVDIDEFLADWRYRHTLMVHRMIGSKVGTGGSSGYDYLMSTVEKHRIFSDFVSIASFLIPTSAVPELPEKVRRAMGFHYGE